MMVSSDSSSKQKWHFTMVVSDVPSEIFWNLVFGVWCFFFCSLPFWQRFPQQHGNHQPPSPPNRANGRGGAWWLVKFEGFKVTNSRWIFSPNGSGVIGIFPKSFFSQELEVRGIVYCT